ncbi:unnamed protein product [Prorocentrum cordatum]|uniref:Uncharacterized protein n=1 Tax=Prorocentrum cordatum TaxID=2364126 RepID=A0ABN9TAG3_9DINO|nr:unnamed protein product [Polarella glacialis]
MGPGAAACRRARAGPRPGPWPAWRCAWPPCPPSRHIAPQLSSDVAHVAIRPGGRQWLLEANGATLRREPPPGGAGARKASPASPHIAERPHSTFSAALLSDVALEARREGGGDARPALPQDQGTTACATSCGGTGSWRATRLGAPWSCSLGFGQHVAGGLRIMALCTAALCLLNENGRRLVKGRSVPGSTFARVCCGLAMKAALFLTAARAYFLAWDSAKMFKAMNSGFMNDILWQVSEDFLTDAQAIDGGLIHNLSIEVANPWTHDLTMHTLNVVLRSRGRRGPGVSLRTPPPSPSQWR